MTRTKENQGNPAGNENVNEAGKMKSIKDHLKGQRERIFMALWILVLLFLWQFFATKGGLSSNVLPSLEQVWEAFLESISNGALIYQTYYSLRVIFFGMVLATAIATIMALLSQRFMIINALGKVLSLVGHPLPALALLPLIIIWFGTGDLSIIVIIIHSALWPIMINLNEGFRAIPQIYLEIGRNLELPSYSMTWEIRMKSSLGQLLSGLRIAFARSWRALIGAEMVFGAIGDKGGIGWYIFKQRTFMNTPGLFVGILVVIIIGILVETVFFSFVEKKTIRRWGP